MPDTADRRARSYRRGLVMGLTMAEVMVLIAFAFLLILGWLTRVQASRLDRVDALLGEVGLQPSGNGPKTFDEQFTTLSIYARSGQEVAAALGAPDHNAVEEHLPEAVQFASLAQASAASLTDSTSGAPSPSDRFARSIGTNPRPAEPNDEPPPVTMESRGKLGTGRGAEPPPCMVTAAGKPAYVLDVVLRDSDIILRPREATELDALRGQLGLDAISYGVALSRRDFHLQTQALFAWSMKQDCRFFVTVIDWTAPTAKRAYKERLRSVAERFFYYEQDSR